MAKATLNIERCPSKCCLVLLPDEAACALFRKDRPAIRNSIGVAEIVDFELRSPTRKHAPNVHE
jgi:hypothetical protein